MSYALPLASSPTLLLLSWWASCGGGVVVVTVGLRGLRLLLVCVLLLPAAKSLEVLVVRLERQVTQAEQAVALDAEHTYSVYFSLRKHGSKQATTNKTGSIRTHPSVQARSGAPPRQKSTIESATYFLRQPNLEHRGSEKAFRDSLQ